MPVRRHMYGWTLARAGLTVLTITATTAVADRTYASPPTHNGTPAKISQSERARLFATLKTAKNEQAGRAAEDAIWWFWMHSAPNPKIEKMVTDAMQARREYNFEKAQQILGDVISRAPNYAEGWNQRAFIHYLQGKPDRSLADIDRALELEPKHFGALSGKARILMEQGRTLLGQKALRQAIEIHPWLKERSMLLPVPEEKKI